MRKLRHEDGNGTLNFFLHPLQWLEENRWFIQYMHRLFKPKAWRENNSTLILIVLYASILLQSNFSIKFISSITDLIKSLMRSIAWSIKFKYSQLIRVWWGEISPCSVLFLFLTDHALLTFFKMSFNQWNIIDMNAISKFFPIICIIKDSSLNMTERKKEKHQPLLIKRYIDVRLFCT